MVCTTLSLRERTWRGERLRHELIMVAGVIWRAVAMSHGMILANRISLSGNYVHCCRANVVSKFGSKQRMHWNLVRKRSNYASMAELHWILWNSQTTIPLCTRFDCPFYIRRASPGSGMMEIRVAATNLKVVSSSRKLTVHPKGSLTASSFCYLRFYRYRYGQPSVHQLTQRQYHHHHSSVPQGHHASKMASEWWNGSFKGQT